MTQQKTAHVVFLRHGESIWNKQNIFTGWTDVPLTDLGRVQAREAGRLLKENGFHFDLACTSFLKRANETLAIVLDELGEHPPIRRSWRLNERHYGALQGLNKKETAKRVGEEQVFAWRRGYDIRPPELDPSDPRHPANDPLYRDVDRALLPGAESLKDMVERTIPFWKEVVVPEIGKGKNILIVGHGTNIRGMRKYLEGISDEEIASVDIPYAVPLVYELSFKGDVINSSYLGDKEYREKLIRGIKEQIRIDKR